MTSSNEQGRVLLVRASGNEADAASLTELGIESVSDPYLNVTAVQGADGYAAATELLVKLTELGIGDWVVATSANGLRHWSTLYGKANLQTALTAAQDRGVRFAAIGAASAKMYADFGIHGILVSDQPYGVSLAQQLIAAGTPSTSPYRALIPAGNLALTGLSETLQSAGWEVFSRVVYETKAVDERPASADDLSAGNFSAVLLRSPSAARAIVRHAGVTTVPVVCGGKTTAAAAESLGLRVFGVAASPDPASTARIVLEVVRVQNQGAN